MISPHKKGVEVCNHIQNQGCSYPYLYENTKTPMPTP